MANYEVGIRTKNRIIKVCKKLFYEKGYDDTKFEDICREGNFNKGTVHYHFQGKYNIGRHIFTSFIRDNNILVDKIAGRKFPDTPHYYYPAMHLINYLRIMLNDEKMKRYYYQISRAVEFTRIPVISESYHKSYVQLFESDDQYINGRLFTAAVMGMSASTHVLFMNGYLNESGEDYIDDRIKLFYRLLGVENKKIDEIIEESRGLCSQIHTGLRKYFKLYEIK